MTAQLGFPLWYRIRSRTAKACIGNFLPGRNVTVMEQAARPSPFCDQGQRGRPGRVVTGVEKSVPQDGS